MCGSRIFIEGHGTLAESEWRGDRHSHLKRYQVDCLLPWFRSVDRICHPGHAVYPERIRNIVPVKSRAIDRLVCKDLTTFHKSRASAPLLIGTASAQELKGWLGADVQDVSKAEADKLGWDAPRGAKVGVVASGSPAEKAGLKTGDIILSIDRAVIDTSSEADTAVNAKRPGDAILLQVLSNGKERRVSVTTTATAHARYRRAHGVHRSPRLHAGVGATCDLRHPR
jgi:PDZ domain